MAADGFPRRTSHDRGGATALMPTHRAGHTWRTSARNVLGILRGRRGCHVGERRRGSGSWRLAGLVAVIVLASVLAVLAPPRARASSSPSPLAALRWAESRAGAWYSYGGTGPGYDCSGLVYEAYLRQGVNIGRSTYDMLRNRHLVRIPLSQAQRGDPEFYGSGHVELKTNRGTFGALEPGTRVGWHRPSASWHPTMAFRVR
jgi:cell wall-associated NlpC family hydrolase